MKPPTDDATDQQAEVQSKETAFKGKLISLELAKVKLPHGATARMEVVRHPGSCVIVAMPDAEHVILVRQYRYAVGQFLWELPAGSLKPGEDARKGAIRECEEEIRLIPTTVESMGKFFPSPGYLDEYMELFKMTGLEEPRPGDPVAAQDEDEHIEVRTVSIREGLEMVKSGEITDLKTAYALAVIAASGK
ncbi:MAG: NUDIX hydrolase [Bacteroidales bacterium]